MGRFVYLPLATLPDCSILAGEYFRSTHRRVRRIPTQQQTNNQRNGELAGVPAREICGNREEDVKVCHKESGRQREETITMQRKHYKKCRQRTERQHYQA